jgi:hypothetical protein
MTAISGAVWINGADWITAACGIGLIVAGGVAWNTVGGGPIVATGTRSTIWAWL